MITWCCCEQLSRPIGSSGSSLDEHCRTPSSPPDSAQDETVDSRDGAITIQMYSSTSTITLNMHEYEYEYKYSENKCTRVRLLYNVLEYEYDYIRM